MSKQHAPYFYLLGEDYYHWEPSCPQNQYPDIGWVSSLARPMKDQCEECKKIVVEKNNKLV